MNTKAKQSEHVKYIIGTTEIDLIDSIINILSKDPGLTSIDVCMLIYPSEHDKFKCKVINQINVLIENETIVESEGQLFSWDDAWSHDVSKTMDVVNDLDKLGVSPQMASYLASGMVMAAEKAHVESKGQSYNPDDSIAHAIVKEETGPIDIRKPDVKEVVLSEDNDDVPTPDFNVDVKIKPEPGEEAAPGFFKRFMNNLMNK